MNANLLSFLTEFAYTIALPVAIICLFFGLLTRARQRSADYSRRFLQRLANPDFAFVERHFGCALPDRLKQLYADTEELNRSGFEIVPPKEQDDTEPVYVAFYEPADEESLKYRFHDGDTYFAFANDGCGNDYMIDPHEPDPPVLYHDHETGEVTPVAARFSEFMSWERREPKDEA
ncbi:SMI1/KNR4 family protein [Rubinisphaera brasiliensis]|uniref:Cell wall assembly/cell proliferation coordinating protein, KNR4 n=1 Tax=Rubinisphaera brasiliensis (strain ATCC 49424 / DSM 5305 / JCM 21570 / IAM 15109 / NBRC 103401 / IFAM 1448) TaxID=756272 RepID=F0SGU0_RUBBR|nr:SMI1/KNR4 family protein [Rubinisphaera brasiliensis]ADY58375.1 Cell wall assembly/cell proliferation coordinating protein, KNR4 [Rubinisphaera brasiliensis DSM 5305]